jgi:hypothetical protein
VPRISGVFRTIDNLKKLTQGVEALTRTQVMVGVPADKSPRKDGDAITNAELAYIHDKGSADGRIPARPFMEPGIEAVKDQIIVEMRNAGKALLSGGKAGGAKKVEMYLNRIGIIATRSIKAKITEGIPPPLAPSTIAGRIRRVKGKARRKKIDAALAAGMPESRQAGVEGLFTPLIVTGALRNSIVYVLRKVGKGSK